MYLFQFILTETLQSQIQLAIDLIQMFTTLQQYFNTFHLNKLLGITIIF